MAGEKATRATLLLRLKADGREREVAWRDFHDQYAPMIRGFARRMGADGHAAEDIVQEVMLGFFAVSPEFIYDPGVGRFRGYLKTCTWRKFQKRMSAEERTRGKWQEMQDGDGAVEAVWVDVWETERLRQAVELVRERYGSRPERMKTFQAFEMNVLWERDAEEVSRELGMKVEGVHQAKVRIGEALRETMEAFGD